MELPSKSVTGGSAKRRGLFAVGRPDFTERCGAAGAERTRWCRARRRGTHPTRTTFDPGSGVGDAELPLDRRRMGEGLGLLGAKPRWARIRRSEAKSMRKATIRIVAPQ